MEIKQIDFSKHKNEYINLNIEFLSWVVAETHKRYKINIIEIMGITAQEYVLNSYDKVMKSYEDNGMIYIVEVGGNVAGMGGVRRLKDGVCEIKRMYIKPDYRGLGYGKNLIQMLLEAAKNFGYSLVKLESSLFMKTAHQIYRSYGFKDCDEYPGVETPEPMKAYEIYMEKGI